MVEITFNIPNDKDQRVVDAMKGIYPIPFTEEEEGVKTYEFTDDQWAKEAVRRFMIRTVKRYEDKIAKENSSVGSDDSIVS